MVQNEPIVIEEPISQDARTSVFLWLNPRIGVLVVVARNEKRARKLAVEQDPIYASWFLTVRPHILPPAVAVGMFRWGGGQSIH